MSIVCSDTSNIDLAFISVLENNYNIEIPNSLLDFLKENNGGVPLSPLVSMRNTDYTIRCFLDFSNQESYNNVSKPLKFFQSETQGKIIPFAKDALDNYFCLNLENGKTYFWNHENNLYYQLTNTFDEFIVSVK